MPGKITCTWEPTPRNARNSEGAFITLDSGRILYIYTRYQSSGSDDGHAVLASRYSDDQGRTWSTREKVVVEQEGNKNVMSVSLLRLKSGRIIMFYARKDLDTVSRGALSYTQTTCLPFLRFSDDEARTWSEPLQVISSGGYYVLNNDRVVELESGRLVMPIAEHCQLGGYEMASGERRATERFEAAGLIAYMLSDDGGESWRPASSRLFGPQPQATLQEPGVIELRSGVLWSWMRSADGYQWQTFSRDQGRTWSAVEQSVFKSPRSPLSMKRIPGTDDLLAIWNDHGTDYGLARAADGSWGRTPLASAVSKDDGVTWQHHTLIEKSRSHGYCYTAIHFTEDDHVLLAYLAGGKDTGGVLNRMLIRRIRVRDFYSGA